MSGPGGAARIHALNVAEKPSVAKAVAEILSRGGRLQSRPGRSPYNRIFEFDYTVRQQPLHMLFTSVTGHLMELDFDDRFRRWTSCDPADLFHAPVRKLVPSDKSDLRRTLEEEARRCRWLVLWLDCDREGENIAFEVLQVCSAANPRLDVWRARFSALVDREIHHSAQNLARPNRFFSDAVDARQEIDLRIGASFTRFQTMLLADAFVLRDTNPNPNPNSHVVLSYGPCQFPTLGFIVERHWEIESHEPEQFWSIECSHVSDAGAARFAWARGHLFDHASAVLLYELCLGDPTATVAAVNHREKLKHPPHPLSTVELQKRASRYFRLGSEQTMKIAEELYQAGFISYPRTETDSFSAGTDLAAIVREQAVHPSWGAYAERLLDPGTQLWRNPSNGGHDDKAHPPIHPARYSSGEANWTADHARVYELVVRHFLACVSQPAVGAETTVEIDIAGESFAASGRTIIARNYLDVYRFESWGGSIIPTYEVGQKFMPTSLTLDAGVTRPPPPLSESDLLSCMDKAGIGTDATMHDHIKKLLDRGYATKDANTRFSPTNLGEALVMGYDGMGYELWKPYLRSMMECDMKAVSLGEKTKDEVLETCLQQMKACFLDARRNQSKLMEAMAIFFESTNRGGGDTGTLPQTVRPCNECQQSNMVLKRRPDGNFMVGCSQYPMCRNVVWLPGAISEAVVSSHVCDECNPGPVFKIQFKFRRLEIPPNYDVDHLGCIGGCDVILRELKEICGTGSRNNPASTGQPGPPSSNSRRSSQTQAACANCGQIGHSSHSCPHMSNSRTAHPPRTSNSQNGASSLPCDSCGRACPQKTANTAKNRGRKFYSCNIQECNFFVWADDSDSGVVQTRSTPQSNSRSSSSVSGSRGRGRGRARSRGSATDGTFVTATGEPVSGRCFTCGDSSHFANNCPHRRV